jgi:hypothetical protein
MYDTKAQEHHAMSTMYKRERRGSLGKVSVCDAKKKIVCEIRGAKGGNCVLTFGKADLDQIVEDVAAVNTANRHMRRAMGRQRHQCCAIQHEGNTNKDIDRGFG